MPELPEVETVVRELEAKTKGLTIRSAEVFSKKIRIAVPPGLDRSLQGRKILQVTRRAKYILVHLSGSKILIIHLGMSGRIYIGREKDGSEKKKHDHLLLSLSGGRNITFNDPRRFGLLAFVDEKELAGHALFSHLGPEPFSRGFNAAYLGSAFKNKKIAVKVALMNQELVVGIGNIYASEALFDAGVDPRTSASALDAAALKKIILSARKVLTRAIKAGGSTLRDYRQANGELGYFQHKFSVYERSGKACGRCTCDPAKTGGVQKIVQGGRSTFYCPRKQV